MPEKTAMPRKKKSEGPAVPSESVRLHVDIVRMARILVAAHGGTIGNLISDSVRPMFKQQLAELRKRGFDEESRPS